MNQELTARLKTELEQTLGSIERQLADYGASSPDWSVPADGGEGFADSAHATAERSEKLSMVEKLVADRELVLGALARIDADSYGDCERCGEPIPEERLEALPTATLCLSCKKLGA